MPIGKNLQKRTVPRKNEIEEKAECVAEKEKTFKWKMSES